MSDLRYPIGVFEFGVPIRPEDRLALLGQIGEAPKRLRAAVQGLLPAQLDTPYRPGGWTVRQVVHHLADAHLNWYIRTKLATTEAEPTIKPYDKDRWAELEDARSAPWRFRSRSSKAFTSVGCTSSNRFRPAIGPASSIIPNEAF